MLGPDEMGKLGFGALLGVAQGSVNEPRMVVMQLERRRRRAEADKPVAFVGKGVTFDTGGISIKPAGGMEDMKWDMAGAGTVIGLMAALAGRKAKVDAVGLVGLVENMPSGSAQRPGDVVKSYSGQTIEVINTDAEGRLVLADVLWYCQQKFDPQFMVDLATLTGAIIISLGHEHAGLFSNDDALAEKLIAAGKETGEKLWRMPLDEAYDKQIKSDIADMKNIGGRPARLGHRGAVHQALRQRQALGASRHRRHGVVEQGRPHRAEGRHRVRRAAAGSAGGGALRRLTAMRTRCHCEQSESIPDVRGHDARGGLLRFARNDSARSGSQRR